MQSMEKYDTINLREVVPYMNWYEIAKQYKQEYIDKTRGLLQIPSVLDRYQPENIQHPFGVEIRRALDFTLQMAQKDGFLIKDIDHYAGHIEMASGNEILGILGHLDVVPTGGKWDVEPFAATIKEGKIIARGAMDDKGPTMAAYIAMRMIQDQKIPLKKTVRLILGCDEESGMRCIRRYLEKEAMPDVAFAPDAEFPLIYGEKGNFSFDLVQPLNDDVVVSLEAGDRYNVVPDQCTAVLKKDLQKEFHQFLNDHQYQGEVHGNTYTIYGKNAHAAWPYLGVNAIFLMVEFLKNHSRHNIISFIANHLNFEHYGVKLGIAYHDEEMKDLTLNTAFVHTIDGILRVGCNIRYPIRYPFETLINQAKVLSNSFGFEFVSHRKSDPHYISPSDPFIQVLHNAYIKYTGDTKTPLLTIGGGTYARTLKKAVAFGPNYPGAEDLAHQPNEYLVIDDMLKAAAIYAESIVALAG